MPASPDTRTTDPWPCRARRSADCSAASSDSRSTSTARTGRSCQSPVGPRQASPFRDGSGDPAFPGGSPFAGEAVAIVNGHPATQAIEVAAGDTLLLRLQVTGTNPTTIRAKVWKSGAAEPSAWQVSTTDTTAKLQAAGAVGSIIFALSFNVLLFVVAPLVLTNVLFIALGWASAPEIAADASVWQRQVARFGKQRD